MFLIPFLLKRNCPVGFQEDGRETWDCCHSINPTPSVGNAGLSNLSANEKKKENLKIGGQGESKQVTPRGMFKYKWCSRRVLRVTACEVTSWETLAVVSSTRERKTECRMALCFTFVNIW